VQAAGCSCCAACLESSTQCLKLKQHAAQLTCTCVKVIAAPKQQGTCVSVPAQRLHDLCADHLAQPQPRVLTIMLGGFMLLLGVPFFKALLSELNDPLLRQHSTQHMPTPLHTPLKSAWLPGLDIANSVVQLLPLLLGKQHCSSNIPHSSCPYCSADSQTTAVNTRCSTYAHAYVYGAHHRPDINLAY
jgi:hypothetical protein